MPNAPQVVLFDIGGVLVRLGGVATMVKISGITDEAEIWRRWLTCRWVRKFERGRCSGTDFAQGVVDDWRLSVSPEEFLTMFDDWPEGLYPGARELVAEVGERVPVGCLSNTNSVHWDRLGRDHDMHEWFGWQFLSHELDLIKPDAEIFAHVLQSLDLPADDVLFVDDNVLNVEAAAAAGLSARQVRGVAQTRQVLAEYALARPTVEA